MSDAWGGAWASAWGDSWGEQGEGSPPRRLPALIDLSGDLLLADGDRSLMDPSDLGLCD